MTTKGTPTMPFRVDPDLQRRVRAVAAWRRGLDSRTAHTPSAAVRAALQRYADEGEAEMSRTVQFMPPPPRHEG